MTLVEVLATMVLVGIVLPVAMRGLTLSMQAAAAARHRTEAAELAELKLAELLTLRDPGQFTGSGDFGQDWPEYRWVSQSLMHDFGLYEVTVAVGWQRQGQERSVELTTFVYPRSTVQ